jgi:hypothetical protein
MIRLGHQCSLGLVGASTFTSRSRMGSLRHNSPWSCRRGLLSFPEGADASDGNARMIKGTSHATHQRPSHSVVVRASDRVGTGLLGEDEELLRERNKREAGDIRVE